MKTDCSQDKFLELGVLYKQYSAVNKPPQIIVNFCHPLWIDYWMCDRPSIVSELKWKAMGLQVYAENCNTGTCEPCPDPVECDSCCPPVEECEPCDPCPDPVECDSCCPPPEDCDSCCPDCDPCDPCGPCDSCCDEPPDPFCGDGFCDPGETCETCPQDCGSCTQECIDCEICEAPLNFEVSVDDLLSTNWLELALEALGALASGDLATISLPGENTSMFCPNPWGAAKLANVFVGGPPEPNCNAVNEPGSEESSWYDEDLWPIPCQQPSWLSAAYQFFRQGHSWEDVRADTVALLVYEIVYESVPVLDDNGEEVPGQFESVAVIKDDLTMTLSDLTDEGRLCVWNYFWACRMAFHLFASDDALFVPSGTQSWLDANDDPDPVNPDHAWVHIFDS
jgi:hypothetical protein